MVIDAIQIVQKLSAFPPHWVIVIGALGPQCSLSIIVALPLSQSAPSRSEPVSSISLSAQWGTPIRISANPTYCISSFPRWFLCSCQTLQRSTLGWFNPACSWLACPVPVLVNYSSFRLTNSLPITNCLSSSCPLTYSSLRIINLWNYLNRNCFFKNTRSFAKCCIWVLLLLVTISAPIRDVMRHVSSPKGGIRSFPWRNV